jgi:hypothetical protein
LIAVGLVVASIGGNSHQGAQKLMGVDIKVLGLSLQH